jgi:hypothetical protein
MVIKNTFGEFLSEKMEMSDTQFDGMIEVSKKFYIDDSGFEMWMEDGFIIIPPDIKKNSILIINIVGYDKET